MLDDDRMIIYGGKNMKEEVFNEVWVYDIKQQKFSEIKIQNETEQKTEKQVGKRFQHASTVFKDILMVFGGSLCENSKKNLKKIKKNEKKKFSSPSNIPSPSLDHSFGSQDNSCLLDNELWLLNVSSNVWFQVFHPKNSFWPPKRYRHSFVYDNSKHFYLFGGQSHSPHK